ncbi:MAG: hypothetical protein IPN76_15830 [Saprospiraceae bacterium]|nr:hypothetical protein [Saprospiraceae bacterium]
MEGARTFKKAASPEDFEKLLNFESNNVNNLDLNDDGEIDFVKVIDNMEEEVHALVLQVAINENGVTGCGGHRNRKRKRRGPAANHWR